MPYVTNRAWAAVKRRYEKAGDVWIEKLDG